MYNKSNRAALNGISPDFQCCTFLCQKHRRLIGGYIMEKTQKMNKMGTEKISRYGSHIAHHRHRGTMKKDERVGNIFFVIPKNRSMFAASFKRAIGLLSNYRTG